MDEVTAAPVDQRAIMMAAVTPTKLCPRGEETISITIHEYTSLGMK
jgi:hypothetical protein